MLDDNSKPLDMVKTGHAHVALQEAKDPALDATQIGWDGIGILVHLSNYTKEVTKQQVADIFPGKVKEWSELGRPEIKILLIDRPRNQNIRDAVEARLGITVKIPDTAKMIGRDEKVVKTVVKTLPPLLAAVYVALNTGLSVVSTGIAVRRLPVDKIEPEVPMVKDSLYSLRRPLLMLSKKEPSHVVDAFARFALSAPCQRIIGETYIPIPSR